MNATVPITNLNALVKGDVCVPCSQGCKVCTATGCTTCNAELGFTPNGTECSQTLCLNQVGKFYNTISLACETCVAGC